MKSKVVNLQRKSKDVLGIFKKTFDNLLALNKEVSKELDVNDQKINNIVNENILYKDILSKNRRILDKLNDFLGL